MANKGIRKHQPLRVPSNWNDESRRFVIQLEQILDDIYMRFGRLGLKDFEDEVAEKIEGAAVDENVVHKTGAEDVGGLKTFTDSAGIEVRAESRYKTIRFVQNGSGSLTCAIRQDAGNATNQSSNKLYFVIYSPYSTAGPENTGYFERYFLPTPDKQRAQNDDYDILTTKAAVSIAQGGTGATSASGARENIETLWAKRLLSTTLKTVTLTLANSTSGIILSGTGASYAFCFTYNVTTAGVVTTSVFAPAGGSVTTGTNTVSIAYGSRAGTVHCILTRGDTFPTVTSNA